VDWNVYESVCNETLAVSPVLTHQQQYMPLASCVLSLSRTARGAAAGLIMSLSPVTAILDVWSDERRCRDTATLEWVFDMPVGKPISRRKALLLARQIMQEAEQNRVVFTAFEARQGIQWGDGE
jgi:hypothetical protein